MPRILIVGGDDDVRDLFHRLLEQNGSEVLTTPTSDGGLVLLAGAGPSFDLVLVCSVYLDGLNLRDFLVASRPFVSGRTPVILITGAVREHVCDALQDARDYVYAVLPKPVELATLYRLVARVLAQSRVGALVQSVPSPHAASTGTATTVQARTQTAVALSFLDVLDCRQPGLGAHGIRVHGYTKRLGRAIGLDDETLVPVRLGALLHDVGKCVLPDDLLVRESRAHFDDTSLERGHCIEGVGLLAGIPLFQDCLEVIHLHHERYDGTGFPRGLKADEIPLGARMCAVANVFDQVCEGRLGRPPGGVDRAYSALREEAGGIFDPELVAAFGRALREEGALWDP